MERPVDIALIVETLPGPATRYGLARLRETLQLSSMAFEESHVAARFRVFIGTPESPSIRRSFPNGVIPSHPEGVFLRRLDENTLVVASAGDRGLMYALLELAENLRDAPSEQPFSQVPDVSETPDVPERALSLYTMHRRHFERRFFDPAYWERYLDLLASSRFNAFVLLFAYESSGYFAPPYPYFFSLSDFPEVYVIGMTAQDQERHLHALNRLVEQVHAHGLSFTLGIWDHIYRGGVQRGPDDGNEWRVVGVTEKNLIAYNTVGLRELLRRVPNLDALQFRMHNESGLKNEEMTAFWDAMYDVVLQADRRIRFDARAKELPDSLIDLAIEKGVPLRICTKYWMEQMGLPFHPTHIHPKNQRDRRHGYADLLRYPQRYKMHWRLWNGGTTRLLLWGDPDYVRRFAESTHLYDGDGFEVNEPLATKMAGQPHSQEPFAIHTEPYRFYEHEFERYWYFFETFGRVTYNPRLTEKELLRGFRRRFGDLAEKVQRIVHRASRVLPRLVATHYPYHLFPMTRGWVEKQRMGDLPRYAEGDPSDTALFLSPKEAAQCLMEGTESAKRHPLDSSRWFERLSGEILAAVAEIGEVTHPELVTTLTDARILAYLALYHARRLKAAFAWNLYRLSEDLFALDDALAYEHRAIAAWEQLVTSAGGVYTEDLMFGVRGADLSGHWRHELEALRVGYRALEQRRDADLRSLPQGGCRIAHVPVRRATPGEPLEIRATVWTPGEIRAAWIVVEAEGVESRSPMTARGPYRYGGVVSQTSDFRYRLEVEDVSGVVVRFPLHENRSVKVTDDTTPPVLFHEPIHLADIRQPLTIRARVHDSSGIRWVRLLYRRLTQFDDYETLEMSPDANDEYIATLPPELFDPQYDFMYRFEAMDAVGNGVLYPDFEQETPYIVVRWTRHSR